MAEGTGLEPASLVRAAVFKTAALPITLPLHEYLYISILPAAKIKSKSQFAHQRGIDRHSILRQHCPPVKVRLKCGRDGDPAVSLLIILQQCGKRPTNR